jgi:hypothetical protein
MKTKKSTMKHHHSNPLNQKKAPQMRGLLNTILMKYYLKVAGQGLPALDFTATVPNSPYVFFHSKVRTEAVELLNVIE